MTTTTRTEARGYRRTYTDYGMGTPGYHVQIDRVADGRRMCAGPFVSGDMYRSPEWLAIHPADRGRIVDELSGNTEVTVRCGDVLYHYDDGRPCRRLCAGCSNGDNNYEGCGEVLERHAEPDSHDALNAESSMGTR